MTLDKFLLFPYYLTLYLRNLFYDKGICKSTHYGIPSICVGNITVGGTGKTPMVEFLVRLYRGKERIAVISRGYRRKTDGYRVVEPGDDYRNVGDEPLQIKRKFPDILVVVDRSRRRAFENLSALPEAERPTLVLLDDAFQHRRIRPDYSILLTSFHQPVYSDLLLPLGHLRDLKSQIGRADMVVVTKVNDFIDFETRQHWRRELKLAADVPLFFSRIVYMELQPVFPGEADVRYIYSKSAVLFSGIASDLMMRQDVGRKYAVKASLKFRDHHDYTASDVRALSAQARKNFTSVLITTEKDAQRLVSVKDMPKELKERMFYVPIAMEIIPEVYDDRHIEEEMPFIGMEQIRNRINY